MALTPEFEKIRAQLPHLGHKENYAPLGLPFFLSHPHGYYGPGACRTLEFIGVGKMDTSAILEMLGRTFECDQLGLVVSRIDLCADWIGTTINDCRKSIKVQRKRNSAQYHNPNRAGDELETQRSEAGRFESLYFGSPKSKDYFRVYDKEAHLRKVMKVPSDVNLPTQWVRFERTLVKAGVPENLRTLGMLLQNGADYDPFSAVEIHAVHDATPDMIYGWSGTLNQRMNAEWTHHMVETYGRNEAARRIRKENRKPQEMFDLLDRVLKDLAAAPMPTPDDLTARYQSSFVEQMFGHLALEPIPDEDHEQGSLITIPASGGNLPQTNYSFAI